MRFAVVVAGVALTLGIAALACSGEELPYAGGLMLAIQTDLAAPKDIAAVGLYITSDGKPIFGDTRNVAPNGEVKFPATLAVLADADRPRAVLKIRAVAFKPNGDVRVLRDVITTIPKARTGLLRMPLLWINEGSGTGNRSQLLGSASLRPRDLTADGFSRLTSACPDGQTFIDGECADAHVDGDALPDYSDADVFGGGDPTGKGGSCFDVLGCFDSAASIALDQASCTASPSGIDLQDPNLSFAVTLPAAADTGDCGGGRCLVPLDKGTGWKIAGAAVEFPRALCRRIADGRATGIVASRACPTKDARTPSCGPASSVTTSSRPSADAGADSGSGVAAQDFDPPIAFGSEPNLTDVAVDADYLFVSRATANPPPSGAVRLRKADVIAQVTPETSVLFSFGGDPAQISSLALDPAVRASHVLVRGQAGKLGVCTPTSTNNCLIFDVLGPPEVVTSGPDEAYAYGSFTAEVGLVAIPYASPTPVVRQILPGATVSSIVYAQGMLYLGTINAEIFKCAVPCDSPASVTPVRSATATPAIVTAIAASDKVPGKIFFMQVPADAVTLSAGGVYAIDVGGTNEVQLGTGAEIAGIGMSAQPPTALSVDGEYVYWSGSFDDPRGGGKKSGLMARSHVTLAPAARLLEETQGTEPVSGIAVDDTHVFWTFNRPTRALVFAHKKRAF